MVGRELRDGSRGYIMNLMMTKVRELSFIPSGRRSHTGVLSSGVTGSIFI